MRKQRLCPHWRKRLSVSQPAERDAHLIQCTGELGRGLDLLRQELRAGDFRSAIDTVATLKTIVELQDSILGGRDG